MPLADALELANRKDAAGQRLMHQMASRGGHIRTKTPQEHTGLMIRNGSSGFTAIASRTWRSSASSTSDCRRCRPRNRSCGS